MENTGKESLNLLYRSADVSLGEAGGKFYLISDGNTYRLADYRFEPCLYIQETNGKWITIHNSFTVEELCRAVRTNGSVRMITGNEYGIDEVFGLIRKAIGLAMGSVDIGYVEGRRFMDLLKEKGALSPETAADLTDEGLKNPNVMNPFIHSKKVGKTADGAFYLRTPDKGSGPDASGRIFRVISDQVRFGCGSRMVDGKRQYFAWHGHPSRNDDYFTTSEISEREYRQIEAEYPEQLSADRETAEAFRKKYVDGHKVILEGWNKLL